MLINTDNYKNHKIMSKFIYVIGAGHGGIINGIPQTAGKRSKDLGNGVIFEGVSNRRLVQKIIKELKKLKFEFVELVPEQIDISLSERVQRINKIPRAIYFSIHSDGFPDNRANGWSAFTSYGETKSDKIATILYKFAKKAGLKLRTDFSDGDSDKEAGFYVLKNTYCPAVLVENLFMTNLKDYKFLLSEKGQNVLVKIIIDTIKEIEKYGL